MANKSQRTRARDQEEQWFKARRIKNRKRNKLSKESRKKNRRKK